AEVVLLLTRDDQDGHRHHDRAPRPVSRRESAGLPLCIAIRRRPMFRVGLMNSRAPVVVALIVIAGLIAISVFSQLSERRRLRLTRPYQDVLLTNGQSLLGRLENSAISCPQI